MTPNNNYSPLPFYRDILDQNHYKKYAYGNVYPLIAPDRLLLPFQIIRPTTTAQITNVLLHRHNFPGSNQPINITTTIKNAGLKIIRYESLGYDVIMYPGSLPIGIETLEGQYHISISDGTNIFVSERFNIVHDPTRYIKIEWYDIDNLYYTGGHIEYETPTYKNILYISSMIGKPSYELEEEGEEIDGIFRVERQISKKVFRFVFVAPEYMCDALRTVPLSDYVNIYTTKKTFLGTGSPENIDYITNTKTYNCNRALITPSWLEQGDIASIEVEFECDTIVKKIGRGILTPNNGDFNNDYNNDFNNQINSGG